MTATVSPEYIKARQDFDAWYDSKSEDTQALVDEICDRTYYIIDEKDYEEFIQELDSYGITNAETFADAFNGEYEGFGERLLTQFAEQWCDDCGITSALDDAIAHCIDYNQYWYYAMQYDFNVMEFNGNTYFFNNNY